MKSLMLLFLIQIVPLFSFGQDSILISHFVSSYGQYYSGSDLSKKMTEEYFVLKKDTSIRNGKYCLKKSDGKLLMEGQYVNGNKTGIWNYYDYQTNELFEKYDVDSKKDFFYKSPPGQMEVKSKKGYQLDSLDVMPHLPGQEGCFVSITNFKYPNKARAVGVSGIVYVSIRLDTSGHFSVDSLEYAPAIISGGFQKDFKKSIEDAVLQLPEYIPAEINGRKVEVRIAKMPVQFKLQ
jgi:hypothetical protein